MVDGLRQVVLRFDFEPPQLQNRLNDFHEIRTSELPLAQEVPLGRQNTQVGKKTVTFFSYIVWPSVTKFGSVRGLAIRHLFPEFDEL